jgi:hypothetical protein
MWQHMHYDFDYITVGASGTWYTHKEDIDLQGLKAMMQGMANDGLNIDVKTYEQPLPDGTVQEFDITGNPVAFAHGYLRLQGVA